MDIAGVLDLIAKGISVVTTIVQAGEDALPALQVVTGLVTGAKEGTLTDDDLASAEAQLDSLIATFNE